MDAGPRGIDPYYGRGVLDAAAAVTAADPFPAAPGVPFDRAPAEPGGSDDTRATARALPGSGATGTFSPEGDVDWYRFDASSAGWYAVQIEAHRRTATLPDADVEIRNEAGDIVASVSTGGLPTSAAFPVPTAGTVLRQDLQAPTARSRAPTYSIKVAPRTAPQFTLTTPGAATGHLRRSDRGG